MEKFESVAIMIGEPVRARMLWSLLDGRAYTATELSVQADVSPQNASMHLSKLVQSELLSVEKQGRHKYYRFASPEVAYAIESLANLVPSKNSNKSLNSDQDGIRYCRTCYDHLAGKVAVQIADQLLAKKLIQPKESSYVVTKEGSKWFKELDINIEEIKNQKRIFARQCLDWSERKHHLAGALGAALLKSMVKNKWVRRLKGSRLTILTSDGRKALYQRLGLII